MKTVTTFEPQRLLKALCIFVLAFIPSNMLFSPLYDFMSVENRGASWTVTMSAFFLILASILFLAVAVTLF